MSINWNTVGNNSNFAMDAPTLAQIKEKNTYKNREFTTQDRKRNINQCPKPNKSTQIYYDIYTFENTEVTVKNIIRVVPEVDISGFTFSNRCYLHYWIEKAELFYDNKLIETCTISQQLNQFNEDFSFKISFAKKFLPTTDLISFECRLIKQQTYFKNLISFDNQQTWQVLPDIYKETAKIDYSPNNKNQLLASLFGQGLSESELNYYRHLTTDYWSSYTSIWDLFSGSSWGNNSSGLIIKIEKIDNKIVFTMSDGRVNCLENNIPINNLYSSCGRKLVFSKNGNEWQFDLKSSIDILELPQEIKDLKANWNEAKAEELAQKTIKEQQTQYEKNKQQAENKRQQDIISKPLVPAEISGDLVDKGKVEILPNQTLKGNIKNQSSGEVILYPNSNVEGSINISSGSVTLMENAILQGEIYAQGDAKVVIGKNAKVGDRIYSYGPIIIEDDARINGLLESQSGGNLIKIGNNVEIKKGIKAYSDGITIGNNFKTEGNIYLPSGPSQITIGNNSNIAGNVENESGKIIIGSGNEIKGKVRAGNGLEQGTNNKLGNIEN